MAMNSDNHELEPRKVGRPKKDRPKISDYMTERQIFDLVEKTIEESTKYQGWDQRKWLLEQYYGKAPQSTDVTSGGNTLNVTIPAAVAAAFNINADTETGTDNT